MWQGGSTDFWHSFVFEVFYVMLRFPKVPSVTTHSMMASSTHLFPHAEKIKLSVCVGGCVSHLAEAPVPSIHPGPRELVVHTKISWLYSWSLESPQGWEVAVDEVLRCSVTWWWGGREDARGIPAERITLACWQCEKCEKWAEATMTGEEGQLSTVTFCSVLPRLT